MTNKRALLALALAGGVLTLAVLLNRIFDVSMSFLFPLGALVARATGYAHHSWPLVALHTAVHLVSWWSVLFVLLTAIEKIRRSSRPPDVQR